MTKSTANSTTPKPLPGNRSQPSQSGFSLLELSIAASLGLVVILAMTSLFRAGMNATFTITQRAETQQNLRAAMQLMTKDISLAGAGLPSGGLQLPTGGANAKIACNQTGTCYVPGALYPTPNYMTGIVPEFAKGVEASAVITSAPAAVNDAVTSIYCDYNFSLNNFVFAFPTATKVTVTPAVPITAGLPTNILAPGGLQVGDLMLFLVTSPGNGTGAQGTSSAQTAQAVGEITGLPAGGAEIDFAAADPLNFNLSGAPNSVSQMGANYTAGSTLTACRLEAVTYFLEVPAAGGTVQTPRLMRQVNGLTAVPVADNIINLQFSYDVINSVNSTIDANQSNPIAAGDSPALIQKVNMWAMAQGLLTEGTHAQSMYLASSVSTRNMSFCNAYSANGTQCQ